MIMTSFDFSPLYRTAIGFDHLASLLNTASSDSSSYPPYNVELIDDDQYIINMAVAGFTEQELDIEVKENNLTIKGSKEGETEEESKFLYRGIATRSFTRRFQLAEYVIVKEAGLENGILSIKLERIIPEAKKPRHIEIGNQQVKLEDKVA